MAFDLGCDDMFYDFGQKGEVGNGLDVAHDIRVEFGLFDDGG